MTLTKLSRIFGYINLISSSVGRRITYETDPETGKQIIPFEAASQWFATNDPLGKFGSFPDADLKHFLEAADWFTNAIASVSGVPKYYFDLNQGAWPSGEALRRAESRFTSLIKDAQLDFGETWGRVMRLALKMDGQAGNAADAMQLETQWTPADPMSSNELVDLAIKKKNVRRF